MAEQLEDIVRNISGKGIINIPATYRESLEVLLYVQVLREPRNVSRNFTWNPDKSFYAHITFCIDDFVLAEYDVSFESQVYCIHRSQPSQNLLSLICAYDGILDSFVQVGNAIGFVISRTNLITEHPFVTFQANKIRFECFSTSALKLTLKGTKLAKCRPEDGEPLLPPPPPEPIIKVPFDEPILTSEAYDEEEDGGDTVPNPIDFPEVVDLPFGAECLPYLVKGTAVDVNGPGIDSIPLEFVVLGEVTRIFIEIVPRDPFPYADIYCECGGARNAPECIQGTILLIATGYNPATFFELISITLSV